MSLQVSALTETYEVRLYISKPLHLYIDPHLGRYFQSNDKDRNTFPLRLDCPRSLLLSFMPFRGNGVLA